MRTTGLPDRDAELLRATARRIGWQLAAACAVAVALVALTTLVLGTALHHGRGRPGEPRDFDDILRITLLVGGVIGIGVAGLVGFVVARRAVEPLGDALARQRRFVADAGHELRTPLTALHTRAQLVARRMAVDDPYRPVMDQLLDDSRVLGEIVDELLASAQLASDPAFGEPVEVAELVAEVIAEMAVLADGRGVDLRAAPIAPAFVNGSRTALRRALTALVDNALGHTRSGGHIVVAVTPGSAIIGLTVTDDGEGIAGGDPDRLTERFARGASPSGTSAGRRFGLGLSLVSEVARSHGGEFRLVPAPSGQGAQAVLTLPIQVEADPAAQD